MSPQGETFQFAPEMIEMFPSAPPVGAPESLSSARLHAGLQLPATCL